MPNRMPPKSSEPRPQLDPRHIMARPNTRFTDKDAQIIAPVLMALEQRDGVIKPKAILDEARSRKSPIHHFFEWDDSKAAEKYRLHTAVTMARAICFRVKLSGPEALNYQPMLVRLRDRTPSNGIQKGYVNFVRALGEPNLRRQMIESAKKDVDLFIKRYSTQEALIGAMPVAHRLREAIEEIETEVDEHEEDRKAGSVG
jgi:hypothetical protein